MADGIKISALTEATDAQTVDGNLLETAVVDSSSSTGFSSKKTPISRLAKYVLDKYTGLSLGGVTRTVKTAIDALKTATDALDTEMDTKADIDGEYDDLVVGTSKQLLSDTYTIDRTPYKYRKSPYTDRLSESIVGCSVAWNQLINTNALPSDSALYSASTYTANGVTFTKNNDGSISVVTDANGATADTCVKIGTANTLPSLRTNKHIVRCIGGSENTVFINYFSWRNVTSENVYGGTNSGFNMWLCVNSGSTFTTPVKIYPQAFDLTQMFGTAVADALYNMGDDGVKLFRSWYPSTYYAYSAPTLEHVDNLESHDMVGFNAFDKSTAVTGKFVNTDGTEATDVKCFATDYIRVIPNTTYYINHAIGRSVHSVAYCEYDGSKNFVSIGTALVGTDVAMTITIGANTHYIRVNSGIDYLDALCVNISDPTRNGTYKPYSKHSYALDASLTLRGLIKYDSSKGIYADGDVYKPDGTVTRKYGIVDLGTLTWTYRTDTTMPIFQGDVNNAKAATAGTIGNIICAKYTATTSDNVSQSGYDKCIAKAASAQRFYIQDSSYTDAASFKAAMSGVYLVYELATPTTESAEPFDEIQITDGTEEYVTDCLAPVGHESKYYANLRSKIEGLPTDFSAIICATEATNKASTNYAVGDFLIYNNTLYKVTTAIAANATLTVGTNITATTIMAEIKALQ